jgi:hypothetical protein
MRPRCSNIQPQHQVQGLSPCHLVEREGRTRRTDPVSTRASTARGKIVDTALKRRANDLLILLCLLGLPVRHAAVSAAFTVAPNGKILRSRRILTLFLKYLLRTVWPRCFGKESQRAEAGQRWRIPGVDQDRALPASGLLRLTKEREGVVKTSWSSPHGEWGELNLFRKR